MMSENFLQKDHNLKELTSETVRALPLKKVLEITKSININNLNKENKLTAIESFKIESQYKKYKIDYNNIKQKLIPSFITNEEFSCFESNFLNLDKNIEELNYNLKNIFNYIKDLRFKSLEKIIEYRSDLIIDEVFSKENLLISRFLKSIIINNINLKMFGKDENFKEKIIEFQQNKENKKNIFIYFNSIPMEEIKTNKVNRLILCNGQYAEIEEIFQSNELFSTILVVNSKKVRIRVPIYFGALICGEAHD